MTDVVDVAQQTYLRRQILIRRAVLATRRMWAMVDPNRIPASWRSGPAQATFAAVTASQLQAASDAAASVALMAGVQGLDDNVDTAVVPESFAGRASDGRSLETLLGFSTQVALHRIALGASPAQALQVSGRWLDQIVMTQVSDAHRAATQVATTAHRRIGGYTRVAHSPCCSRCAILSGRWYRYSSGFARHPRCDCTNVPTPRDALKGHDRVLTADKYFESLPPALQERIFTKAGAAAIRDGADINQVVNARRGMETAGMFGRQVQVTSEGVTGRGVGGQRRVIQRNGGIRLTPDQIYRDAGSRDDAIRLLREHGYLTSRDRILGRVPPRPAPPAVRPPADPPSPGPGGGRGAGRRPLVGELLPVTMTEDELDGIEDALMSVVRGPHGPYRVENVHVDREFTDVGQLAWAAEIHHSDGRVIGAVQRTFHRDQVALRVEHDLQELDREFRRHGFATAFGAFMRDWYRESGVATIGLIAGLEDGGYHWAKQGFRWRDAAAARGDVIPRLERAIAVGHADAPTLAAARDILRRFRSEPFGSRRYPRPIDVAMIGESEGAQTWLGRDVMRGSVWHGVMAP